MNRPWFQFWTRDWLDNKELRRCSPLARSALVDLMCVAHECTPYGHLSDKCGALLDSFLASRCHLSGKQFKRAVAELQQFGRIAVTDDGRLYVPRMVRDEDIRLRRASGGVLSEGNPKCHKKNAPEGYPSTHPSIEIDSRARVRAGSDSDSDSYSLRSKPEIKPVSRPRSTSIDSMIAKDWPRAAWALREKFPDVDDGFVRRLVDSSVDAFLDVPTRDVEDLQDEILADAIRCCTKPRQTSAGLYLDTVPQCIRTWAHDPDKVAHG